MFKIKTRDDKEDEKAIKSAESIKQLIVITYDIYDRFVYRFTTKDPSLTAVDFYLNSTRGTQRYLYKCKDFRG